MATEEQENPRQHSEWITDYGQYTFQQLEGDDFYLTPEDFIPKAPPPRGKLDRPPAKESAIPALLFLGIALLLSITAWNSTVPFQLGISKYSFFTLGDYWRAVSALFMHADISHFLSNSWLLIIFGWLLYDQGGHRAFPTIPLIYGALTNISTVYRYPEHVFLVGASGMVYGMVGFWLVLFLKYSKDPLNHRLMRATAFILIILMPTTFRQEVSYSAHAIGFVLGVCFAIPF